MVLCLSLSIDENLVGKCKNGFYLPLREAAKGKEMATAKVRAALFEKVGVQPGTVEKLILLEDHPEWRFLNRWVHRIPHVV